MKHTLVSSETSALHRLTIDCEDGAGWLQLLFEIIKLVLQNIHLFKRSS